MIWPIPLPRPARPPCSSSPGQPVTRIRDTGPPRPQTTRLLARRGGDFYATRATSAAFHSGRCRCGPAHPGVHAAPKAIRQAFSLLISLRTGRAPQTAPAAAGRTGGAVMAGHRPGHAAGVCPAAGAVASCERRRPHKPAPSRCRPRDSLPGRPPSQLPTQPSAAARAGCNFAATRRLLVVVTRQDGYLEWQGVHSRRGGAFVGLFAPRVFHGIGHPGCIVLTVKWPPE